MRRFSFEPYDRAEEFFEFAVSLPDECYDLGEFLAECKASAIPESPLDMGRIDWEWVRYNLERLADLKLPHLDKCFKVVVLRDDWDDKELVVRTPEGFVWFHWYTTA